MNFGLWDLSPGIWTRIYQLTVADSRSPTHTEHGVTWFGSHQHMGDAALQLNQLDTGSFTEALELFCKTINLTLDEDLADPFVFELKN